MLFLGYNLRPQPSPQSVWLPSSMSPTSLGWAGFVPIALDLAVRSAVAQDRAKLLLFEDVGGGGAFRRRWDSLGRAGCREVRAASPGGRL